MQGPFKPGDILGIDHLGRQFLAHYVGETNKPGEVKIQPIPVNVTYYTVSKRDIQSRWRFSKGRVPMSNRNGNIQYG